jgi:copper(I)-binding protein
MARKQNIINKESKPYKKDEKIKLDLTFGEAMKKALNTPIKKRNKKTN